MSTAVSERVRALPIPDSEPSPERAPYLSLARDSPAADQPTLGLALVGFEPFDQFDRLPTRTSELPDPTAWSRRLVQAVIEALSGVRPVAQLIRWTTPDVYAGLQRRCHAQTGRRAPGRRAVVRSVRICQPADGVVEASAVVVALGRVQAVALRLEGLDGRWRMTALELG
jgi:uncharacterized protein DUF6459